MSHRKLASFYVRKITRVVANNNILTQDQMVEVLLQSRKHKDLPLYKYNRPNFTTFITLYTVDRCRAINFKANQKKMVSTGNRTEIN